MSSMLLEYTSSSSQYSSRQGVNHWHYGEKQRLFTTEAGKKQKQREGRRDKNLFPAKGDMLLEEVRR
ncbi:hypothetical protein MRB53_004398 [Persea americana]|uniref:Uncharacterized protein n=1 Tax=Persea americana TaxID=3435 RepID=A0ACC2MAF4_PERAE|nr:hypothetical protein MRB53_004398 [Persea americana]